MHDNDPGPLRSSDEPGAQTPTAPLDELSQNSAHPDDDSDAFSTLRDDVTALIDDARTYAEAEIAFQKTRAGLAGKATGRAIVLLVLALVLLHIAVIALAVGAVIALAPLVTIWGAIAIVVGVLLAGVAILVLFAARDGKALAAMFSSGDRV